MVDVSRIDPNSLGLTNYQIPRGGAIADTTR